MTLAERKEHSGSYGRYVESLGVRVHYSLNLAFRSKLTYGPPVHEHGSVEAQKKTLAGVLKKVRTANMLAIVVKT